MAQSTTNVEALQSFPTTRPAMRFKGYFENTYACGNIHTGQALVAVAGLPTGGILESVGDFEPKLKFTVSNSVDYFTIDADGSHGRVNAQGVLTDDEGRSARVMFEGFAKLSPEVVALVYAQPGSKTLPFGYGIEVFKFQTGHPEYKALQDMTFVGSLRFTYEDGVKVGIDIRISQVISGTGME